MTWFTRLKMGETITVNGTPLTLDRCALVKIHAPADITIHHADGTLAFKKDGKPPMANPEVSPK